MSSSQHLPLDSFSDELPQPQPLLSSLWRPIAGLIALSVIYHAYIILYRLALHPLAKVPGPKLHAASWFPFLWQTNVAASAPRTIQAMHRKYGPVVRVGPDQVALDGSLGWSAVFAHSTGSLPEFGKPFEQYFPGDATSLIGAPRDRHRRIRRQLAHAFSAGALAEQEATVTQYVELLLDRLRTLEGDEFDIIPWLNFTTFDIIGDLAFSDSFGSLASSAYHPWVLSIFRGIRGNALRRFLRHYPSLGFIAARLGLARDFKVAEHNRHTARDKAAARMRLGVEGPAGKSDFMTYMLRKTRTDETAMDEEEILSTSPILVVAGSETTATALAGFFFFLAQNPDKRELVVSEIMEAFPYENSIDMRSTARLEYLHAALEETLRLYPPVTTLISVHQWATFRNPENFHLPEQFLPERWLPASHPRYEARFDDDNRAVFKPFSHGPRDCIGKNLAYAEMRLLAARMLRSFEVTIEGQSEWQTKQRMFGLWEKIPLNVRVKSRSSAK
ncbi:Isotrichodermin C-15 hydroxylase [Beauveria bassiana D1-5]|uniref:Isotrichodermin C-15 hydroxylase n=1 Tax=Beauveria bassiana D1-5 TaxID=1245745 RepID=A0A0A2VJN3_BEABA|nr:Isotrichodermin C-15 hydroxylase [Beauveria bassiana D1-5]